MIDVQRRLLRWYCRHGRHELPWRRVRAPYRTLVSEFMLAQTQVERVIPKFEAFLTRFPDLDALAFASPADVLREWKGLGYNSRAVRLQRLARIVAERYGGALPSGRDELRKLPGVGAYGAAAIRAFGFDIEDAPVDTNVRRIVNRLFFGLEYPRAVIARELDARAHSLIPQGRAHDWNSALMDLGAAICTARAPKCLLCPLRAHCVAAPIDPARLGELRAIASRRRSPQARVPFSQTTRHARGRIIDRLRALPPGARISLLDLYDSLVPQLGGRSFEEMSAFVGALQRDGLVTHDGTHVALRE
ncbi:MAG: A/G-specific adenine glycosylase [Candidatus Eremiobacteraeota bacterium]|nr:A/G-specific adenine glycosylase [Candidatus Eremiobacteraeota bacterium]